MNFDDIFFAFYIDDYYVLFPRDRFTPEGVKSGTEQFDVMETKKGGWLAIPRTEDLELKFQPRWRKRKKD